MKITEAKVGMSVSMNEKGAHKHEELPQYYPVVGTVGTIISVYKEDADALVDWGKESGTEINLCHGKPLHAWYCEVEYLEAVKNS